MKTTQTKPKISCFSDILDNLHLLKDTGLLTNERIDQLVSYLKPESFAPARLENGRVIPEWFCHLDSGHIFNGWTFANSKYIVNNTVLGYYLTEAEIIAINERANQLWCAKRDAQKFEKAQKVKASEWTGPVYLDGAGYKDGYFDSVEDYLDWAANEKDDWDEDEGEFVAAKFVWAVDDIKPVLNFDVDDILERFTEEAHEGFENSQLAGLEEFKKAVDEFVEKNKSEVNWYSTEKIAVILE